MTIPFDSVTRIESRFNASDPDNPTLIKSCVDHIYSNKCSRLSQPVISNCSVSDHQLTEFTRFSREAPSSGQPIFKRLWKNFSEENFLLELSQIDFDPIYSSFDINFGVSYLTDNINKI